MNFKFFFLQYFNNEQFETDQFDKLLKKYQDASLKTASSLAFLNFGQNLIFSTALTAVMLMASQSIVQGCFFCIFSFTIKA